MTTSRQRLWARRRSTGPRIGTPVQQWSCEVDRAGCTARTTTSDLGTKRMNGLWLAGEALHLGRRTLWANIDALVMAGTNRP